MEQVVAYICFIRYRGEPGSELKGRKLLHKKNCDSCHRFGGVGGDIGPDIGRMEEYISPIRLVESMWNHGPNLMEAFEQYGVERPLFKGNDIVHIAAGIRSYMSPTRFPAAGSEVGDPDKGERLCEEKGCMICHSYRGEGGDFGPDFAEVDLHCSVTQIAGKMWNHGPKMWEIMKREGIGFPVFREGEMADVIAYLYGLQLQDAPGRPERGSEIVHDKGCLKCHALRGKGGTVSKDLGELKGLDSPFAMIAGMWNHAPGMRKKHLEKGKRWPRLSGRDMADLYAFLHALSQKVTTQ